MKSKLKNFFREKKDLLIFMGVLVLTFVSVFTIAAIATKNEQASKVVPSDTGTPNPVVNPTGNDPIDPVYYFKAPLNGEYVITRKYYDSSYDESVLEKAVFNQGNFFEESRGVSYSKEDNSAFDVLSVFPGKVVEVTGDEESVEGYTITIEHDNKVTSKYLSLSSVSIKVGDVVSQGQKIGVAGKSVKDAQAGIHVHLQLLVDNQTFDPEKANDKKTSDLVSAIVK